MPCFPWTWLLTQFRPTDISFCSLPKSMNIFHTLLKDRKPWSRGVAPTRGHGHICIYECNWVSINCVAVMKNVDQAKTTGGPFFTSKWTTFRCDNWTPGPDLVGPLNKKWTGFSLARIQLWASSRWEMIFKSSNFGSYTRCSMASGKNLPLTLQFYVYTPKFDQHQVISWMIIWLCFHFSLVQTLPPQLKMDLLAILETLVNSYVTVVKVWLYL